VSTSSGIPSIISESPTRRIDELLNRPLFRVDSLACMGAAQVIRHYRARSENTPWGHLPSSIQLTFKLAFIAACHQINWDYLQSRLAENLLCDDCKQLPQRLAKLHASDVQTWLSDYHKPLRIRAKERAQLMRDVGQKLLAHYGGDSSNLLREADYRLEGPSGFLSKLDIFEAYKEDPLRKKSHVLVQDLTREEIARFHDEDKIEPAIDYHIMRLYLRSGRVAPLFSEVGEVLKGRSRPRPRLVKLLRKAVGEALGLTAFYAGLNVSATNYIEWQIGRSICLGEAPPNCLQQRPLTNLDPDIRTLFHSSCPYIGFCLAYTDDKWRALKEPDFVKSFY